MSEDSACCKLSVTKTNESIDWNQCILCQESKRETVVQNPKIDSYEKLLESLLERSSLQDGEYVAVQTRLQGCSKETMLEAKATWHRSFYLNATNQVSIQRARDRFQHAMSTGKYASKNEDTNEQARKRMQAHQLHQCHLLDLQQSLCQKTGASSVR